MGLNDKTLQALTREDLNDYDALRAVCEKDLNDLQLTMGMRVMLKKAVAECKRREHADVNYSESIYRHNSSFSGFVIEICQQHMFCPQNTLYM